MTNLDDADYWKHPQQTGLYAWTLWTHCPEKSSTDCTNGLYRPKKRMDKSHKIGRWYLAQLEQSKNKGKQQLPWVKTQNLQMMSLTKWKQQSVILSKNMKIYTTQKCSFSKAVISNVIVISHNWTLEMCQCKSEIKFFIWVTYI